MNFLSHSEISVVFFRVSSRSSGRGSGSFLWCSHHSMTFAQGFQRLFGPSIWSPLLTLFRTDEETLGRGIASSVSPMSAIHHHRISTQALNKPRRVPQTRLRDAAPAQQPRQQDSPSSMFLMSTDRTACTQMISTHTQRIVCQARGHVRPPGRR